MANTQGEPEHKTPTGDFADRLDHLFATARTQDGDPFTAAEIARRARARGYELSETYISHLRTRRVKSPSFRAVEALADAFDIDVNYFKQRQPESVQNEAGAESPRVRAAFRGMEDMQDEDVEMIEDIIRSVRRRRGLPDDS